MWAKRADGIAKFKEINGFFCAFDRHSWTPMRDLHLIGGCVIEDHVSQPAVAVVRGHDVYPN